MKSPRYRLAGALVVCVSLSAAVLFFGRQDNRPARAEVSGPRADIGVARSTSPEPTEPIAATDESRRPLETRSTDLPQQATTDSAEAGRAPYVLRVLTHQGAPAPGAQVEVWIEANAEESQFYTSNSMGMCAIGVQGESHETRVLATLPEQGSSGVVVLSDIRPTTEAGLREIVLYELGTLSGQVVGTDGSPVVGARVSVTVRGTVRGAGTPRGISDIIADSNGQFLVLLEATRLRYSVRAERHGVSTEPMQALVIGDADTHIVLRFAEEYSIQGQVFSADQSPTGNATVTIWEPSPDLMEASVVSKPLNMTTAVDASGRFRFDLPHGGRFFMLASSPSQCSSVLRELSLTPDDRQEDLVLELLKPMSISGVVEWESGQPVADVFVAAIRDETDDRRGDILNGERLTTMYGFPTTRTAADGSFRLQPVRPGSALYKIMCLPDATRRKCIVQEYGIAPGSTGVRIVITERRIRGAYVHGTVVTEDTGLAVDRFSWILYEQDANGTWHKSLNEANDPEGAFRREGLKPGTTYAATILPRPGYLQVLVPPWVGSLEGTAVDLILPVPRTVECFLPSGVDGAAGSGMVFVERIQFHPETRIPVDSPADATGLARFHLAPGNYRSYMKAGDGSVSCVREFVVGSAQTIYSVNLWD